MPTETRSEAVGGIKLPLIEAFHISIENIRIRLTRAAITTASIVLGIAFMTFLMITITIFRYSREAGAPIEAYQYWLALISLLVCVVSITNSTLIAVYERYKEIGTMKCLGALDRHILVLFLIESFLLGLIGGFLGFVIGAFAAVISCGLQLGFGVVFSVPLYNAIFSFGTSVMLAIGLSVIATIYPAYQAAKSSPVEALRVEI